MSTSTWQNISVSRHVDSTVAILTTDEAYVAHRVDVLYINLPEDMDGGKLHVWQPQPVAPAGATGRGGVPPADETVTPELNMHVSFRGDAKHGVQGFDSAMDTPRVSIVLEQYQERIGHARR